MESFLGTVEHFGVIHYHAAASPRLSVSGLLLHINAHRVKSETRSDRG